jgi:hypothetical protein
MTEQSPTVDEGLVARLRGPLPYVSERSEGEAFVSFLARRDQAIDGDRKEAADALEAAARAHADLERKVGVAREALERLVADCTRTKPAIHDDCGTRIVTAPSVEGLRVASAALKELSSNG